MVTEAAQHIITAGGKRFRPLLVVLGSLVGPGAVAEDVTRAAVVVELTHVGSLYHDDVMDEAGIRRGSVSANERWGNTVAILVGDFLFSRASDVVAELGPEFVKLQSRTFSRLVQGQIAETVGPVDGQDPLDHYLKVVADKTGIVDRHVGAVRVQAGRRAARGAAGDGGVRRADRHRVPAQRRHHRHHQRRDGQDARHRSSGGDRDPADAAGPQVHRPGRCPTAGAPRLRPARRRRPGRGARPAAPPPEHRAGPVRGPSTAPSAPAPSSTAYPPAPPATPSPHSAPPSSPAPPDPSPSLPASSLCQFRTLRSISRAALPLLPAYSAKKVGAVHGFGPRVSWPPAQAP